LTQKGGFVVDNENLGFSFEMADDFDRPDILAKAAAEVDALQGFLGAGDSGETPEGEKFRGFAEDSAKFAVLPDVYRITDKDFLTRDLEVPVPFKQLTEKYDFYWLYFPISLFPRRDWFFNLLEVRVEFNPGDENPHMRPRAYQILPNNKFQTLLEARDSLEIHIDENFQFSADTGDLVAQMLANQGPMQAGVDAEAVAEAGIVAGPFVYTVKRAKIRHTPTGMEEVFWRLDGAEFFQEDDLKLIVIAQVPKSAGNMTIEAQMQAYRRFDYLGSDIQSVVRQLPKLYKNYITAGMPLRVTAKWDDVTRNA